MGAVITVYAAQRHTTCDRDAVTLGSDPMFMSTQEANRFFHSEIEKWAKVVKASGAKVD